VTNNKIIDWREEGVWRHLSDVERDSKWNSQFNEKHFIVPLHFVGISMDLTRFSRYLNLLKFLFKWLDEFAVSSGWTFQVNTAITSSRQVFFQGWKLQTKQLIILRFFANFLSLFPSMRKICCTSALETDCSSPPQRQ
jgi:hypothetical protein